MKSKTDKGKWNEVLKEDGTFKDNITLTISGFGINKLIRKKAKATAKEIFKELKRELFNKYRLDFSKYVWWIQLEQKWCKDK